MSHPDPDVIALFSLGEPVNAEVAQHLATCAPCHEHATQLRRAVAAGRSGKDVDVTDFAADPDLAPPPRRVWEAIAREANIDPALLPDVRMARPPAAGARISGGSVAVVPSTRRRWIAVAAAAAVIGAGLGVGGTYLAGRDNGAVVASAELDPLGDEGVRGVAEVRDADAVRTVDVHLDSLPTVASGDFLEVWLLSPNADKMITLGTLDGDGAFVVPATIDLTDYPVVDVSIEPNDGNPAHSGRSIARGDLATS